MRRANAAVAVSVLLTAAAWASVAGTLGRPDGDRLRWQRLRWLGLDLSGHDRPARIEVVTQSDAQQSVQGDAKPLGVGLGVGLEFVGQSSCGGHSDKVCWWWQCDAILTSRGQGCAKVVGTKTSPGRCPPDLGAPAGTSHGARRAGRWRAGFACPAPANRPAPSARLHGARDAAGAEMGALPPPVRTRGPPRCGLDERNRARPRRLSGAPNSPQGRTMNPHTAPALRPERHATDCWDWIAAEEVLKHALAAFYMASRAMERQPVEYRDVASDNAGHWTAGSRQTWLEDVLMFFELRLAAAGYNAGLPENHWAVEQLAKWRDLDIGQKIHRSARR